MSHYTYILYSDKIDKFYKGSTSSIQNRLARHNGGHEKYTKKGIPWKLLWYCTKDSKGEAQVLEYKLKNLSRKRLLVFMLKYSDKIVGPDDLLFIKQMSGC